MEEPMNNELSKHEKVFLGFAVFFVLMSVGLMVERADAKVKMLKMEVIADRIDTQSQDIQYKALEVIKANKSTLNYMMWSDALRFEADRAKDASNVIVVQMPDFR